MKKIVKACLPAVLLAALVCSCETTGNVTTKESDAYEVFETEQTVEKKNSVIRGLRTAPNDMGKNELLSVTKKVSSPEYFELSDWSKIRIVSDLMDVQKLHEELSNEEKIKLMSYLFDNLPKNAPEGPVRDVYLGQYYSTQDNRYFPLAIRISVASPAKSAEVQGDKVLIILTNTVRSSNNGGAFLRNGGAFLGLRDNPYVAVLHNDGLLTNIENLNAKQFNSIDSSKLKGFEAVMYSQALLQDEDLSNDETAHKLCTQIIDNKKSEVPAIVMTAMLMEYSYRISKGSLEDAKEIWSDILAYSANVPGDMNKDNLEALSGGYIHLLEALKAQD